MRRKSWWVLLVLVLAIVGALWAGRGWIWNWLLALRGQRPAPSDAAAHDWPDSPAGAAARRWVEAFSEGEDAMRVCLTEILAPESIAQRGIDERLETYRGLRDRFGSLVLVSIDKSEPNELAATLIASDLARHKFIFTVQSEPPHMLISVGRIERGHGGHSVPHN